MKWLAKPLGDFVGMTRARFGAREDAAESAFDHFDGVNGSAAPSRADAARRRHGHDDDAFISATSSIPGRAGVSDRINRAKGMAVRQAIQLTCGH